MVFPSTNFAAFNSFSHRKTYGTQKQSGNFCVPDIGQTITYHFELYLKKIVFYDDAMQLAA
jgi:cephalosporin-C deacetylase-like acetyl esterase